jgi:hypothetical protein
VKETLAVIGAVVAALGTVPYLIDIVRGKTKPNIVTWLTWTMLTAISGAAALTAGEPKTAAFLFGNSLCTGLVVVLGLKYGTAKFSKFDILCQASAVLGLVLWLVFDSPVIGIVVPLVIDFIGALPTIRHSWLKPSEETWQTFLVGVVAPMFTLFSLTRFNIASLAFPLYLFLANGTLTLIIVGRRKQLGIPLSRSNTVTQA